MSYFRFNCTVAVQEDCAGTSLDRCGAINQNLTQSDICSCVIPSLDFSLTGSDYDCLSQAQIDDISGRGSSCYTFFDGTNEYINYGAPSAALTFTKTSPFSGSLWMFSQYYGSQRKVMATSDGLTGWDLSIGSIDLRDDLGGTMQLRLSPTSQLPLNEWVQYGWTYDGSNTRTGIKLYVNGALCTVGYYGVSTLTGSMANASNLTVGSLNGGAKPFLGFQQNVAIFDKELSVAEMLDIHSRGKAASSYSDISNLVFHSKLETLNPIDEVASQNGTSINMDSNNIFCGL
jgi:hypothetical protein